MTASARERQPRQLFHRVLYGLTLASFFFPFAIVKSCGGGEEKSFTGFELMVKDQGGLLAGVLLLAVLLFALSFRVRVLTAMRRGAVLASKALLCALALFLTSFATGMTFLFDQVREQFGFYICVTAWGVLYILSIVGAVRYIGIVRKECRQRPPPFGLALGILMWLASVGVILRSEPNGVGEVLVGLGIMLLFGAPLVLLAMLLAARYRERRPRPDSV